MRCRCEVTPYCSKTCQKRDWTVPDSYGKTHRDLCGPLVDYRAFAGRGAGAAGPAGFGDSLEQFREATGRYPLEAGYVFAGRRVPPLRDLRARALPVGAEIPPTPLEIHTYEGPKVVEKIEEFHRVRGEGGCLSSKTLQPRVRVFPNAAAAAAAAAVAGTEDAPTPNEFSYDMNQECRVDIGVRDDRW
mmetsp:Transcript_31519/g.97293  ORF Transcript_31519/g.97293 Transcript_31519/m.97293 type:complete len:188 (+) Transcript_31519:642-1205(+)